MTKENLSSCLFDRQIYPQISIRKHLLSKNVRLISGILLESKRRVKTRRCRYLSSLFVPFYPAISSLIVSTSHHLYFHSPFDEYGQKISRSDINITRIIGSRMPSITSCPHDLLLIANTACYHKQKFRDWIFV